jgi:hypothetical protein
MKILIFTALLAVFAFAAKAQTITVKNTSQCTVHYYLAASSPTCSASYSTVNYAIPPGTAVTFTFGTATWGGTPPPAGSVWSFIKEWNPCGPYAWMSPTCSGTPNQNVCAVGIPCSSLPLTSCMVTNTSCNTCSAIKTQWTNLGGGSAHVLIW